MVFERSNGRSVDAGMRLESLELAEILGGEELRRGICLSQDASRAGLSPGVHQV